VLLFVLIPVLWLALVLTGLTIFRAAAHSDASYVAALADWLKIQHAEQQIAQAAESLAHQPAAPPSQLPASSSYGSYRAAG
jgi:hypothetical protein